MAASADAPTVAWPKALGVRPRGGHRTGNHRFRLSDEDTKNAGEIWSGLKLVGRSYALIGVASFLWHAPLGMGAIDLLRWVLVGVALVMICFGGLGILASAAVWRNLLWRGTLGRAVEWRGGRRGSLLLAVPGLLILGLIAAVIFSAIGRFLN